MSHRVVCSVATDSWVAMQGRLLKGMSALGEKTLAWTDALPRNCPKHRTSGNMSASREDDCRPYAFKAYAMREAQALGYTSIMWCDSCIIPMRSLEPIWKCAERDGVWMCKNGYKNSDWTADSAYADLFFGDEMWADAEKRGYRPPSNRASKQDLMVSARLINERIEHVVATAFAISTVHPTGEAFLREYFRLASETRAFCGPWQNSNAPKIAGRNNRRPSGPCGPPSVLGHRHDQSAASVIAWRLGVKLHDPVWFSYAETPETILLAKGEI